VTACADLTVHMKTKIVLYPIFKSDNENELSDLLKFTCCYNKNLTQKFEDTRGVIRSRKMQRDRQHNSQKKKR